MSLLPKAADNIRALGLPRRILTALSRSPGGRPIYTIADLCMFTELDIRMLPGAGPRTLKAIREALAEARFALKGDPPPARSTSETLSVPSSGAPLGTSPEERVFTAHAAMKAAMGEIKQTDACNCGKPTTCIGARIELVRAAWSEYAAASDAWDFAAGA